jgi:hypothetical protein
VLLADIVLNSPGEQRMALAIHPCKSYKEAGNNKQAAAFRPA